jgi:hypothetical protein
VHEHEPDRQVVAVPERVQLQGHAPSLPVRR